MGPAWLLLKKSDSSLPVEDLYGAFTSDIWSFASPVLPVRVLSIRKHKLAPHLYEETKVNAVPVLEACGQMKELRPALVPLLNMPTRDGDLCAPLVAYTE